MLFYIMIKKLTSLFAVCIIGCIIFSGCDKKSTNEASFTNWVDESKAQKIAENYAENDWVTISMANDWTTIFAEDVSTNPQ